MAVRADKLGGGSLSRGEVGGTSWSSATVARGVGVEEKPGAGSKVTTPACEW